MNETATKPLKRVCPPAKKREPVVCGKRRSCGPHDAPVIQPFPTEGVLFDNMDVRKRDLEDRIDGHPGKVRSYKMTSVAPDERGQFEQYGSGPNFQGGCLTLCTCAHQIRVEKRIADEWKGWWLAGFTSPRLCGRIWLFYLAHVECAYPTAASLWAALPANLRQAKATRRNRLGDAFEPNPASSCADPFDAAHYHPPMVGHSHHETASDDNWKKDIEFFNRQFKRHSDSSRENLKAADVVFVTDPNKPDFRPRLLHGERSLARIRPYGESAYEIQEVDIDIDSTFPAHLEQAKAAIVAARPTDHDWLE